MANLQTMSLSASARNRGIATLWQKWKADAPLLLTVMDYDTTKNLYDPARLFQDSREEYEYAACVAEDLAALRCANSTPMWRQFYNKAVQGALGSIGSGNSATGSNATGSNPSPQKGNSGK